MNKLRIGYFADGKWSHNAFVLISHDPSVEIAFICARYDNPDPILRDYAKVHSIPFVTEKNINSESFAKYIHEQSLDLIVSMSFNQIFKDKILSTSKLGAINCHAGKLPYYRGRNILNWALINDEKEFGITVHFIDKGIDTGDIIVQETFPIDDNDDYSTLLERAYVACAELLYRAITRINSGNFEVVSQSSIDPLGFYCSQRLPGDEKINWNSSSRDIFNFVRALCLPGPMATSSCELGVIQMNKVRYFENAREYKGLPGTILTRKEEGFLVKTADTFVEVLEYRSEFPIRPGTRLV